MKYLSLLCLAVVLAVIVENMFGVEANQKECKKIVGDLMKKQMGALSACTKKLKFKSGKEKAKKMNCILRCVMIDFKIMDQEGQASSEFFEGFLTTVVPSTEMQSKFNETIYPCMEIAFKGFKTLEEDEYCTTYDPFVKCAMAKVPTVCDSM